MTTTRAEDLVAHIRDAARGMRNRIAHGYFDINLDVVWNTLHKALPDLQRLLPGNDRR